MTTAEILTVIFGGAGLGLNLIAFAYGYGRISEKLDAIARRQEKQEGINNDLRERSESNLNRIIHLEGRAP